jgi:RNA polymerase sigma factor (sigma-70 family)
MSVGSAIAPDATPPRVELRPRPILGMHRWAPARRPRLTGPLDREGGMTPHSRRSTSPTDAELIAGCAAGDATAWREIVHRHRRLVYGVPRTMGLQPADADEVFQRTFVELLRALPNLRQPERVSVWLVTTARRASMRLRRQERRRVELSERAVREPGVPDRAPAADARLERLIEGEWLRGQLESIGDPCRALLTALFADPPRPYRAVARELGLAIGSLGATRARCLERLRRRLLRPGPDPSLLRPSGDGRIR